MGIRERKVKVKMMNKRKNVFDLVCRNGHKAA